MEDKKLLEVGDKIIAKSRYGISGLYTIERVTKTQAIAGNSRFYREINHNTFSRGATVRVVGGNYSWNAPIYYIATPELIEEFLHQKKLRFLEEIKWSKEPKNLVEMVYDIVIKTREKSTNDTI